MLFTDTITVYNHYKEDNKDKFKRTILKGVQWSHNKAQTTISNGVMTENKVESITIDFSNDYGNEAYINPIEFEKEDDHSGHWTLNTKGGKDMAVLGIGSEITDEYTIKNLKADNQYIGIVAEVSDNRNRDYLKTIKAVIK